MRVRWVACCNIEFFAEYASLIDDICAGRKRVKKLVNYAVPTFRAKINHADRLLFTTKVINGEPYLFVESVVLNHNYSRPQQLKATKSYAKEVSMNEDPLQESDEIIEYNDQVIYYAGQYIQLPPSQTTFQNGLKISAATVPVVISGPAGSGKSCVLFNVARELFLYFNAALIDEAHIIYVTKSTRLAKHQAELWGSEHDKIRLSFYSYEEWIAIYDNSCTTRQLVDFKEYTSWLNVRLSKELEIKRLQLKTGVATEKDVAHEWMSFFEKLQQDPHLLYEEWRAMPVSFEEYQAYGARQSVCLLLTELPVKAWIYQCYQDYQKFLQLHNQWDPAFHVAEIRPTYDAVLVDEAQDLSILQLRLLLQSAKISKMYCAMDSHQRLHDRLSLRPLWLDYVTQKLGRVEHVVLKQSYRCPQDVLRVVNVLLSLKRCLAGGKADRDEMLDLLGAANESEVAAVISSSAQFYEQKTAPYENFRSMCLSTDCVVITRLEHVQEAKDVFSTPLVCTAEELKGLEFKYIICYRLFDASNGAWREINRRLAQHVGQSSPQHKSMRGEALDSCEPMFNEVIVAFTRTLEKLYVIQQPSRDVVQILEPLKKSTNMEITAPLSTDSILVSSQQDWLERAHSFVLEGLDQQAQAIYCDKLKHTNSAFVLQKQKWQDAAKVIRKPEVKQNQAVKPRPVKAAVVVSASSATELTSPSKESPKTVACISPISNVLEQPPAASAAIKVIAAEQKLILSKVSKINKIHDGLKKLYRNFTVENLERWCILEKNVRYFAERICVEDSILEAKWIDLVMRSPTKRACFTDFLSTFVSYNIFPILIDAEYELYALHQAVKYNDIRLVQLFIDKKVDLDVIDVHGFTPFHLAIQFGYVGIMRRLLQTEILFLGLETQEWNLMPNKSGGFTPRYDGITFYQPILWVSSDWFFDFSGQTISSYELIKKITRNDPAIKQWIDEYEKGNLLVKVYPWCGNSLIQAVCSRDLDLVKNIIFDECEVAHERACSEEGTNALVMAVIFGLEDITSELISSGFFDVNHELTDGVTLLLLATQYGYLNVMKRLLRAGADVHKSTSDGLTPLLSAVHLGRIDAVKILFDYGADSQYLWRNKYERRTDTALSLSRARDIPGLSELIIQKDSNKNLAYTMYKRFLSPYAVYNESDLALMSRWSCVLQEWNVIKTGKNLCFLEEILSDQKITVKFLSIINIQHARLILEQILKDSFICERFNALHIAARSRFGGLFLQECVKHELDMEGLFYFANHPLLMAISENNLLAVRAFLMCGVNIAKLQPQYESALFWTLIMDDQGSHASMLKQLLRAPYIREHIAAGHEYKAMHYAVMYKKIACLREFFVNDLVIPVHDCNRLLHESIHSGSVEVVDFLLEQNADLNSVNHDGETAFIIATWTQQQQIFDLLITKSNVHAISPLTGFSTLMHAVQAENVTMVRALLACQVQIDHVDNQGQNAIDLALETQNEEIIVLLMAYKCEQETTSARYGRFYQEATPAAANEDEHQVMSLNS